MYIYDRTEWPRFEWDAAGLQTLLSEVRNVQGRVVGKMGALGVESVRQANLAILTQDIVKSSEIEGEFLDSVQVRSALARRLGLDIAGMVPSAKHVDGMVEVMVDATTRFSETLTINRLFGWHGALFPSSRSGMNSFQVGRWRTDASGPMQVISGTKGEEKVHFQAPPASRVDHEMGAFLAWMHSTRRIDPVIKSALAHLWFMTMYPFDEGNGRIARAIAEMVLSQSDGQSSRFYSMSIQIYSERTQYRDILERTQKGPIDVSEWLHWFFSCLMRALKRSDTILQHVEFKHRFWMENAGRLENDRQKNIMNMLLDGFEGKLTTSAWAELGNCSQDTALRDIQMLLDRSVLFKLPGGGRSTAYDIAKHDS